MNIFLLIVVLLQIITIFQYVKGTATCITIDETYNCKCGVQGISPEVSIKKIKRLITSVRNVTCNETSCFKSNVTYNVEFENSTKFQQITFTNLDSSSSRINGNELFAQHGLIGNGICAGGFIYKIVPAYDPKGNSCTSNSGLTKQKSIGASFIIVGGRCATTCKGRVIVKYNPGIN